MRTFLLASATATAAAGCLIAVPSSGAAVPPSCGNQSLAVTATATQGATGHGNLVLRFRNRTTHSCTLYGYPGLDALSRSGHVLAHARRTLRGFTGGSTHGLQNIVVRPGRYASADVEWMNFRAGTGGTCAFSHSIAATPANTTHTVRLARSVSVCNLQVHPTVAGTTGNS